jgi:hypothetical protein
MVIFIVRKDKKTGQNWKYFHVSYVIYLGYLFYIIQKQQIVRAFLLYGPLLISVSKIITKERIKMFLLISIL